MSAGFMDLCCAEREEMRVHFEMTSRLSVTVPLSRRAANAHATSCRRLQTSQISESVPADDSKVDIGY